MLIVILLIFSLIYFDFRIRNSNQTNMKSFWFKIFKEPIHLKFVKIGHYVANKVENFLIKKYGTSKIEVLLQNKMALDDLKILKSFGIGVIIIYLLISIIHFIITLFI